MADVTDPAKTVIEYGVHSWWFGGSHVDNCGEDRAEAERLVKQPTSPGQFRKMVRRKVTTGAWVPAVNS